jgi:hypothetical protein
MAWTAYEEFEGDNGPQWERTATYDSPQDAVDDYGVDNVRRVTDSVYALHEDSRGHGDLDAILVRD